MKNILTIKRIHDSLLSEDALLAPALAGLVVARVLDGSSGVARAGGAAGRDVPVAVLQLFIVLR